MNKFKFYFILLITTVIIFSCSKDDDNGYTPEPPRDYATQYETDSLAIDEYLRGYYITVTNNPGQTNDQDVTITKIPTGGTQAPIISYLDSPTFPKLKSKIVKLHGIEYTMYYLILREGIGKSPCSVDGVFSAYKGTYLYRTAATTTEPITPSTLTAVLFEEVVYPNSFLSLFETITGWGETFPEFKTGTYTSNPDGTIVYNDFGAGVMFLPSGLGYYNNARTSIPAYSPLVFSFKLYEIKRLDQDLDGIPSYLEDLNGDGYMRVLPATDENRYVDDTDEDGIPDFADKDDDGDNYTTLLETQYINPLDPNKTIRYYPFDGVLVDDPTTLFVDERQGIPAYSETGTPDYTTPGRIRIHVDKDHHTAIPTP